MDSLVDGRSKRFRNCMPRCSINATELSFRFKFQEACLFKAVRLSPWSLNTVIVHCTPLKKVLVMTVLIRFHFFFFLREGITFTSRLSRQTVKLPKRSDADANKHVSDHQELRLYIRA